ncbi:MAG: AMP-binding protein, partial [Lachnospiraceae bacterium]|nr:AMP-binding protein [Lachnospiraceae bacterium]
LSLGDDPFAMTVCPDDVVTIAPDGEILVRAPLTMMKGYLDDPEATAAVLRDGVLSTGDLGFLDENGCLHITGRKKEILVLSDGTKIFLPEYEALLAAALPGRDFAAILKEGRPALLIRGNPEERDELLKKTAAVLKNMPRGQQLYAILFTGTPLPRTSAGKLKRKEIETMADTAGRSTS